MLVCRVLALFATIVIMESSPALPEKIYDDNTLVIKLYSPFGQAAVGNYHDLHVAVNKVSSLMSAIHIYMQLTTISGID